MPIKPYDHTTYPTNGALGSSSALRNELDAIETGFDMVATEIETALTGALGAATIATTKAAEALASANNADISEAAAAVSAAAALVSQNAAATSETNAAASALQVSNTYDAFDDRYLGTKAVAPALDNDGNALQQGTLYWDSVLNTLRGYNGAAWVSLPSTSAGSISNTPSGNLAAANVQAALNELQTDIDTRATTAALTEHIDDTTDAHDATAISTVASGNLTATNVGAALNELQTDIDTRALNSGLTTTNTNLTNHLSDIEDAHDASAISSVASGNLAATNVQAALNELQTDIDTRALASNLGLGYGQTWQDVTASRAFATTYTNSTGRPIQIAVTATGSAIASTFKCVVNGVDLITIFSGATQNQGSFWFVVPVGATYSVNQVVATITLQRWVELR